MTHTNYKYHQNIIEPMKNNFLLFIISVLLSFSACSNKTALNEEETTEQQTQQQFTVENLQNAEEPEFVIEADYDPTLAKKAAQNKKAKTEQTSPITLTADDDDLQEDYDDLPSRVNQNTVTAYDYEGKKADILDDAGFTAKGFDETERIKTNQNHQSLFFVVAGAFRDEALAIKKSKEIEALGYKVELISFDSQFKTICIAKLEDSNQANLLAKTLQAEKVDAYVVKRRK
jgi:hypothetical protein